MLVKCIFCNGSIYGKKTTLFFLNYTLYTYSTLLSLYSSSSFDDFNDDATDHHEYIEDDQTELSILLNICIIAILNN